jgi:hypothetical protein
MGYLWLLIINVAFTFQAKIGEFSFLDKIEIFIYLCGLLIYFKKPFSAHNLHILQCSFS